MLTLGWTGRKYPTDSYLGHYVKYRFIAKIFMKWEMGRQVCATISISHSMRWYNKIIPIIELSRKTKTSKKCLKQAYETCIIFSVTLLQIFLAAILASYTRDVRRKSLHHYCCPISTKNGVWNPFNGSRAVTCGYTDGYRHDGANGGISF